MKKKVNKYYLTALIVVAVLVVAIAIFLQQGKYDMSPSPSPSPTGPSSMTEIVVWKYGAPSTDESFSGSSGSGPELVPCPPSRREDPDCSGYPKCYCSGENSASILQSCGSWMLPETDPREQNCNENLGCVLCENENSCRIYERMGPYEQCPNPLPDVKY